MPPTAVARCIRPCRSPSFGWLLIPIPDLICLSHFHTFGACFACERLTHENRRLCQMFAVESSFIRIDIRGRTNLPQNRKTIHNEDINDIRYCITILAYFDANLVGTLVLVNVLFPANWSGNTTNSNVLNPRLFLNLQVQYCMGGYEFRLDEGGEKTKQNGVCSFIREQWPELPELLAVDAVAKTMPHKSLSTSASRRHRLAQCNSFKETVYMLRRVARVCEVNKELSAPSPPPPRFPADRCVQEHIFSPFPYPPVVCRREYRLHLASPRLPVLDYQQHPAAGGTKSHCVGDRGELEAALSRTSLVNLELVQAMHSEVLGSCIGLRAQAMLRAWRVGAALRHAARARLFRVYYGSAQREPSVALTCRSGWAGECDYASGGGGLYRRRIQGAIFTAGCTGMQGVSWGDNYIILPSRLTPIDQFGRAQHFAMKLGAIKNNYLIGLSWLARSTLLSTASAHNSDIHGERRPRLMRDGALPKRRVSGPETQMYHIWSLPRDGDISFPQVLLLIVTTQVYGLPGELSQEIPKSRVAYDRDCEQLWDVETRFTRITKVGLARAAVKFLEMRMEHQTDSGSVFEAGLEQGLYDSLSKAKEGQHNNAGSGGKDRARGHVRIDNTLLTRTDSCAMRGVDHPASM
ncbi:hypothetical protein B0H14DRAFT_3162892 [Mycena olivaceomarginata]|nr:hypothetical protein B0H14DRAFT_3162892 [Mycena olivaceomarginata]